MQQILLVLQLVLALLSNPATANDPNVQALAIKAVNLATIELSQAQAPIQIATSSISLSVPVSSDNPQPVVITVVNPPQVEIGSPDLGSIPIPTPPETPSAPSCSLQFVYSQSQGAEMYWTPSSTEGELYGTNGEAGGHVLWTSMGAMNRHDYGFGRTVEPIYKAVMADGTTCLAWWPTETPKEGDVTTGTMPSYYVLTP